VGVAGCKIGKPFAAAKRPTARANKHFLLGSSVSHLEPRLIHAQDDPQFSPTIGRRKCHRLGCGKMTDAVHEQRASKLSPSNPPKLRLIKLPGPLHRKAEGDPPISVRIAATNTRKPRDRRDRDDYAGAKRMRFTLAAASIRCRDVSNLPALWFESPGGILARQRQRREKYLLGREKILKQNKRRRSEETSAGAAKMVGTPLFARLPLPTPLSVRVSLRKSCT